MQLSLKDIKQLTNQRSFSNAMMLIETNQVTVNDVIKSVNMNQIITYSMNYNSMYQVYRVSVKVDKSKTIISHSCDCMAHEKYGGLCKHLIALCAMVIKYENPDDFYLQMNILEGEAIYRLNKAKINSLASKLQNATQLNEAVGVRPILGYRSAFYSKGKSEDYAISLKVGITREYVVKDAQHFLKNVLFNKVDTYGKLEFNHNINSFNPESQDLLRLLLKNGSVLGSDSQREITITPSFLDEFFRLYDGKFIDTDFGKEKKYLVSSIDYSLEIIIDDNSLRFVEPGLLILNGFEYYHVLKNDVIYRFKKPNSLQLCMVYDYLISNEQLSLVGVEDDFVSKIYPLINKKVTVSKTFIDKYPIQNLVIDTFFDLVEGNIVVKSLKYINEQSVFEVQDPFLAKTEQAYYSELEALGFIKNNEGYELCDPATIVNFINTNLESIKNFGNIYLSDELSSIRIKKVPHMQVSVKYNINVLEFKISNPDLTAEEVNEVLEAYRKKKKYVKLKNNKIYEIDENVEDINSLITEYGLKLDYEQEQAKPINYLLKLVNEDMSHFSVDQKVEEVLFELKNYKQASFEIPQNVKDVLRDYQVEAFNWLKTLIKYNFGGILADDMGLGKTIEIISVLMSDEVSKPSIIVCPTSLVYNWTNEFVKWNSGLVCKPIIGDIEYRKSIITQIKEDEKIIYITSYDTLRRDIDLYSTCFRFIITDEAQFIKNQFAKKSSAVKKINSEICFSLTGTPIENGLSDLWSIFDFVMPGYLADYNHFKNRYEQLIMQQDKRALESLVKKITPFILRRTKKDVLNDLPEKIESIYYTKLSDEQQKLYDSFLFKAKQDIEENSNKIQILALLMRLRQICVDPKMFLSNYKGESSKVEIAVDLIRQSINSGHKLLVFSQFTSIFEILGKKLKESDIAYSLITGATKSSDRLQLVNEFNENDEKKVFLISLKAGGTGLNLTGADIVIHLDPWWNVSAENQATDRAYRIGQTRDVEVIKIICADTIEQRVLELQNAKKDLADSIINNEDNLAKLSRDDLAYLLS